jgi:hypothetical protein
MANMKRSEITFYNSDTGVEWKIDFGTDAKLKDVRSFLNALLNVEGSPASLLERVDYYVVTSERYAKVKRFLSEGAST